MAVEFGVLGPLVVSATGRPVELTAPKLRIVLASLLMRPARVISTPELMDNLWDEQLPADGRSALQTYVMRLRGALGPARHVIRTEATGYKIDVSQEAVDHCQFRSFIGLAQAARNGGNLHAESRALRSGLALWRGRPLADVPSHALQQHEVPRLEEERLVAVERRIDVDLDLGRHAALVSELYSLTAEHQLRERFWGQLMVALYRSDRQADALRAYHQLSTLLREELGLDPCEQLRELYQGVLCGDQVLAAPRTPALSDAGPARVAASRASPFQVPHDVADFVGREDLMSELAVLGNVSDKAGLAVLALSGPPGVGKTALAFRAAHRLRQAFPDGQLFADLRGYSSDPPKTPSESLEQFLRALGIPSAELSHGLDEQGALFRSVLADRRVLVILDNARDADQVRPLLPGSSSCVVIVTSRDSLLGLSATDGARAISVGPLPPAAARTLLSRILGRQRVAAEATATDELAALCSYLPLAIRIVAVRLAARPRITIASAVRELRSANKFAAMAIGDDEEAAVYRAFERSYRLLQPSDARLFRLVSLIPGRDFDRHAAASVAAASPGAVQGMLERLEAANLIYARKPGRFQFHGLIRDFAHYRARYDGGDVRRDAD